VYLNLDGQGTPEENAPKEIVEQVVEDKKTSPFIWVAIGIAVVGLGLWYYKSKNQSN
jgi:hypothetical protein